MDVETELTRLKAEIAEMAAGIATRDSRIAELEAVVEQLREELGRNSANSHLPPSTDPPGKTRNQLKAERQKRKRSKGCKRGGQPGHQGSHRRLLPPEQVDEVIDLFPGRCENCWESLPKEHDPQPKRYQFTELRPLMPWTEEYRRHSVSCVHCGHKTRAAYDAKVIPRYAFGPRLMSVVALLTGIYNLSRRKTVGLLWDLLGVRLSLGTVSSIEKRVSDASASPVAEVWTKALNAEVKHADGTTWLRAGVMVSLWTIATTAVTVFKIVEDSRKLTLKALFKVQRGVLISDRATALKFWAMHKRQICWAHLLRKFVSFSERDGPVGALGHELIEYAAIVFQYWHDYQDGKLSRAELRRRIAPVRPAFKAVLERGVKAKIRRLSGSCIHILEHEEALWTFVDVVGVEPTNNHAEQEIRAFVLWRKRSFGTQSERGDLFAERLMTIAHTARKQGVAVLGFIVACCQAHHDNAVAPSLFDRDFAAAA